MATRLCRSPRPNPAALYYADGQLKTRTRAAAFERTLRCIRRVSPNNRSPTLASSRCVVRSCSSEASSQRPSAKTRRNPSRSSSSFSKSASRSRPPAPYGSRPRSLAAARILVGLARGAPSRGAESRSVRPLHRAARARLFQFSRVCGAGWRVARTRLIRPLPLPLAVR
jgi:hypothetical protein